MGQNYILDEIIKSVNSQGNNKYSGNNAFTAKSLGKA